MPRKKRSSSPFELMDDDFDEDASSQSSRNGNPPIQRNAANARERARMRVLSSAFGRLKTKLPNIPADTKLSKLDTLRLATMYIKQLKAVVEGETPLSTNRSMGDHDIEGSLNDTPSCYLQLHSATQSMNWPFGLHHQVNNNSSSTRLHISPSSSASNGNVTTTSWCQTEANVVKQSQPRYETDNYNHQQQQQHHQCHEHEDHGSGQHHDNSPYLLTPSTPQNSQEITWYSETPSPDLSNSSGGGYDSSHLQRHSLIMEHLHLSHIQLTPPTHHHSSAAHPFQHQHHHHHQSIPNQYSHHHQQPHQHVSHHHSNTTNLAATSIR